MPELPEVEVVRQGVAPHTQGHIVRNVVVRNASLRWPIPAQLPQLLSGCTINEVRRRGKYLLFLCMPAAQFTNTNQAQQGGWLLVHLGMSGSLTFVPHSQTVTKHDHVDIVFEHGLLRYNDPRRFGAMLWHAAEMGDVLHHPLLAKLGCEPLEAGFSDAVFYAALKTRQAPIKQILLAGDIVVGVGNIYASEALFRAGIRPSTRACNISRLRAAKLAQAIRNVLTAAIEKGGSSISDFVNVNGRSGYFQQDYFVYARADEPCKICASAIRLLRQGQRSSFYCPSCQR